MLTLLDRATKALSHAEVSEQFDQESWDRATLYRNLLDLVRVGLARRKDLGDHIWRFERARNPQPSHPHFICTLCGEVSCMPGLTVSLRQRTGIPEAVKQREVEVEIRGCCDRCRKLDRKE